MPHFWLLWSILVKNLLNLFPCTCFASITNFFCLQHLVPSYRVPVGYRLLRLLIRAFFSHVSGEFRQQVPGERGREQAHLRLGRGHHGPDTRVPRPSWRHFRPRVPEGNSHALLMQLWQAGRDTKVLVHWCFVLYFNGSNLQRSLSNSFPRLNHFFHSAKQNRRHFCELRSANVGWEELSVRYHVLVPLFIN